MIICGLVILMCWHVKTRFESRQITADLTTTAIHSVKLQINDVKPDRSLIHSVFYFTDLYCAYKKQNKNENIYFYEIFNI